MKQASRKILSVVSALMIAMLLSACGPRMKTVTDYIPPITDSGMRCVEKANRDRAACESGNKNVRLQCHQLANANVDQAFQLAKDDYTTQLESYIRAGERYDYDLAHYKEQIRLILRDGELKYIRCSDDVKMQNIEQFPNCKHFLAKSKKRVDNFHPPRVPIKPLAPNRDEHYQQYISNCNNTRNNCEEDFIHAYQSCGGTISSRKICVSNCDG